MLKKFLLMILVICILLLGVCASAEEEFSFRSGIKFGMTKSEVKALEGGTPKQEEADALMYTNEEAAGKDASLIYYFEGGKLYLILVVFEEEHTNDNLYIDDFEDIDEALKTKYGTPYINAEKLWKDDTYKSDPNDWGFAVCVGDLIYMTSFSICDGTVEIMHGLNGDNYEANHMLAYEATAYSPTDTTNTSGI